MRELLVAIEGRPPTPNNGPRSDWHAAWRSHQDWKDRAWMAAGAALADSSWPVRLVQVEIGKGRRTRSEPRVVAEEPMELADLEVEIVVPDRARRDYDNGVASLKPLIDGCVAAQVIRDDSTRHIGEFRCRYVTQPGVSRVLLRWTERGGQGALGLEVVA